MRRVLLAIILLSWATSAHAVLQSSWNFDQGSGNATDSVNARTCTFTGDAAWAASGLIGTSAMVLAGAGYCEVTGVAALRPATQYAISIWFTATTTDTLGGDLLSMGDSYACRLQPDGNIQNFFYAGGSSWPALTTTGRNLRNGAVHHVVCQRSASQMEVWIDGNLAQTVSSTGTISYTLGSNMQIGRHGNANAAYDFIGTIDQAKVYDAALTSTEITALYGEGPQGGGGGSGLTYHVRTDGLDAGRTCSQAQTNSAATALRTIANGMTCLHPGDTLTIHAGNYDETGLTPPSGSAGSHVTIKGAAGETVTIRGPTGTDPNSAIIDLGLASFFQTYENLILDGRSTSETTGTHRCILINSPSNNFIFRDMEIKNCGQIGVTIQPSGAPSDAYDVFAQFIRVNVHDNGFWYPGTPGDTLYHTGHGYYESASAVTIDGGSIYNNAGHGIQWYRIGLTTPNVMKNVQVYGNCQGPEGGTAVGVYAGQTTFRNNIIYNNTGCGLAVWLANNSNVFDHNTVMNNSGTGLYISGSTNTIRNNIVFSPGISDVGSGTISSNNLQTNPSVTNAAAADFTPASGSLAINGGIPISGFSYCGSAPDIGAIEAPVRIGAEVGLVGVNTIAVSYCVINQPLTNAVLANYSARVNSGDRPLTAATIVGSTQVHLTLSGAAITAGQTVDETCTYGCVGSALIGTLYGRQLAYSQQSVTNTVGGTSPVYTQSHYRIGRLDTAANSPTWVYAADAGSEVLRGVQLWLQGCVSSANAPGQGYRFYADKNAAAAYQELTATCGSFGLCIGPDAQTNFGQSVTSNQLPLGANTFVPGAYISDSYGAWPIGAVNSGQCTEWALALQCTLPGSYTIQVRKADGSVFDTYTVTPTLMCGVGVAVNR